MNDFLISFVLGIVEGLTEFIPISSTAHLRIVEALFGFNLHDSFWKMYTIVIQLGAILALPVYFWRRILTYLATFPRGEREDRNVLTHPLSLTLIAFVVTAVPAYLLKKQIGQNLENLSVMAWALLIGGVVMWVVDVLCRNPRTRSSKEPRGSQPSSALIFSGEPTRRAGSTGRSKAGLCFTCLADGNFTTAKAVSTKSRTECVSPVATT